MKGLLSYSVAILKHLLQTHKQTHEETQIQPPSKLPHKCQPAPYPERVNAGLEVVGEGVGLEQGAVRDGAEGVIVALEFLLQLQGLLETGLFAWRLSAGVEQRRVRGI